MTDARVERVAVEALIEVTPNARVERAVVEVLYGEEALPTDPEGPMVAWWDGDSLESSEVLGWWDGDSIESVEVLGWWDGSAIQPLS